MHEAHNKFPECSKCLQITQEGISTRTNHDTIRRQMPEKKKKVKPYRTTQGK